MSSREGGPDVPEGTPGPDDDGAAEENTPSEVHHPPEVPGAGANAFDIEDAEPPRRRRRSKVTVIVATALVLVMVVVMAVPVSRDGILALWCDVTGGVCPGEALPPITEDEEIDWRVRVEPEEAALWGNYVSLGDSYSSGDGAGEYDPETAEPGECWRSENAYPKLIEQEFDFVGSLGFYACSGHRGSEMLEQVGTSESQLERVTENTSLVTVGIGGNDLGFISVLRTCIVRMPLLERTGCTDQEAEVEEKMDTFEETLTEVLGEIRDRAPDARVLVLGYPRLFPEEPPGMYYTLSNGDQLWLNTVAQRFNDRIRDTAYRVDGEVYGSRQVGSVEYVNVFSSLTGHEVSADDAWLNGIVLGELGEGLKVDRASFHPTAEGQRSVAERVRLQILEGPERVLYQSRDRLESVSPEKLSRELGGPLDPVNGEPEDEPAADEGAEEAAEADSDTDS